MAKGDKALISLKMELGRETPGTHVYKNSDDGTPIKSLYITKAGLKNPPKTITVTVE